MPSQTPDTTNILLDDAEPPELHTKRKTCRQKMTLHCEGLADLLKRFTPVQDSVLRYLNIRDIVALSRTTKALRGCVDIVERTQFDVNTRLKRFFKNPKAFRSLQAKHNIVISGTFALRFISRNWLSSELRNKSIMLDKLLVAKGPDAEALKSFLTSEGYKLSSDDPVPPHTIVVNTKAEECPRVACVELETPPFCWPRNAALTCAINFITWDKAYSVFAYQTHILQEGYLLRHIVDEASDQMLTKWGNIGISITPTSLQDALSLGSSTDSSSTDPPSTMPTSTMLKKRLIGDRSSWIIRHNTDDIEPPPFPDRSFDYAGFEVTMPTQYGAKSSPFNHYAIKTTILKSHVLRHQYAFADEPRAEHRRFRDHTVMQLYALPSGQRPPGFAQIFAQRQNVYLDGIGDFVPPGRWIYYDDEMVKMLEIKYPGAVRVIEREE